MSTIRISAITTAFLLLGAFAETCEAGPLLDWMRGRQCNRYTSYYRGPAVQTPGTCTTTCPKTCYQTVNRVVANYVPYTAFRTEWYRVPVTYYRPVTSSNPQTGCVTTCMKPCTYYQMQARRVPYTTYQTVYRTVQHRIPYTVYETTYGTSCGSCTSCGTGASMGSSMGASCSSCGVNSPQVSAPATVQSYGLNPASQYSVPANSVPQLSPGTISPDTTLQKPANSPVVPVPEQEPAVQTEKSSHIQPRLNIPANPAPVVDDSNKTASLFRGKWDYSPVRTVAYTVVNDSSPSHQNSQPSQLGTNSKPSAPAFRSAGWKSVGQ